MRDLEQLLRYEIPGLLIIVYFIMLSHENARVFAENYGICLEQVLRVIPALLAAAAILALPLGYFAFIFYNFWEDKEFLKKRVGIREGGTIEQILINYPAHTEHRWWENQEDLAVKNEILDIVSYSSNDENRSVDTLERFIGFHHVRRVIGVYVPMTAAILHLSFASYIGMNHQVCLLWGFIATIFLYYLYYCMTIGDGFIHLLWRFFFTRIPRAESSSSIRVLVIIHLLWRFFVTRIPRVESFTPVVFFISLLIFILKPHFLFLLFIVWLITVPWTLEGGMLKRRTEELETNILLSRQREIVEAIARRVRR